MKIPRKKRSIAVYKDGEWMMLHLSRTPHRSKSETRDLIFFAGNFVFELFVFISIFACLLSEDCNLQKPNQIK